MNTPNRREFIKKTTLAALAATAAGRLARGAENGGVAGSPAISTNGLRIKSLTLRDNTIIRHSAVHGDNWHLTWAVDDRQYCSMCDGYGWFEQPPEIYNSRLIAIEGEAQQARFHDVPGYPELAQPIEKLPRYYNFGVLALDNKIYQFLSTWPFPLGTDPENLQGVRFMGVKAIYSPDNGRTWHNQDGSTPVVWEDWDRRSRETMLFFEEPQDTFSMLSVLQMGKNYEANRDGYVYIYSPNGNTEGTMNELVMFRVPKAQIMDRKEYEYFAGLQANGVAKWSSEINERAVVHTFPSGWVNTWLHPWAWIPSVTYNEPLGLYMMTNWATGPGPKPKVEWFDKPSYLGFWVSPNPWGPWTQIHEDTAWTPGGDTAARCYSPIIAPKWMAADGKSFWLVWTDFQSKLSTGEMLRKWKELEQLTGVERVRAQMSFARQSRPYYSFNLQRVDINLG